MDWELLMRIRSSFAETGAAILFGLLIVIAIGLVAVIKEALTGG